MTTLAPYAIAQSGGAGDVADRIDLNPAVALERIDEWIDGAVRMLPNLVVGVVVLFVFWLVARITRAVIRNRLTKRNRANLGDMLGGFARWTILVVGFFVVATILVPSLRLGDLIAGLGVSSVAIGFAFKDILQNWLAGLLILLRQPFRVGDQIEMDAYEGTVERIETRATLLRTYDGQRIVIPNSQIYTNPVTVKTAYSKRRSEYDVGIGYADDIEESVRVLRECVQDTPGVEGEPGVQVLPWDLAASWVTLRVRWWTDTMRGDLVATRARVIERVKNALDAAGIDMPYDTQVQLFHDQTEASDGDRSKQREGWPLKEGETSESRWNADRRERDPGTLPA